MYRFHKDVLFNTVLCDQSIDSHISRLSNSMASILSLFIHSRVPISIIKYNITGSSKIEAYASRSCTRNEAENSRIIVESLYNSLSEFSFRISIQSDIIELKHIKNFLKNIKHLCHLGEHERFLASIFN